MTVSIIVPMYYGKKYLNSILNQIEQCAQNVEHILIELILYNDSPDEKICVPEGRYSYCIKIFNSEINCGIHGARVQGLKQATGDYVLFLDQDDRIAPSYIGKQLACIGTADAVVCRAIHNNRLHYTNTHVFEKVISKEFMLKKWCPIVSPGQVLIKKTSIPALWRQQIMRHNGSDDYFLWLLMVGEGKKFSLNQEVLFEHVFTGINTSGNTNQMMDSEKEMIEILKERHVFEKEEERWLHDLPESLRKIHIKELDNCKRAFSFYQMWSQKVSVGVSPIDFFDKRGVKRIAIYGAGEFGKSLEVLMKNSGIRVCFFIDQNAEYIISEIPVYKKENIKGKVDAVIVTIKDSSLIKELETRMKCPVFDVDEIWM